MPSYEIPPDKMKREARGDTAEESNSPGRSLNVP
jgi:hypothetical protein